MPALDGRIAKQIAAALGEESGELSALVGEMIVAYTKGQEKRFYELAGRAAVNASMLRDLHALLAQGDWKEVCRRLGLPEQG